jgi:DNA polymerase III epsilon subunit family exonuclease
MRIVFWDLETSGLNPYHDQIIEIAALDNQGGRFHSLIRAMKPLSAKVREITGISDEMLREQPTLEETLPEVISFLSGADWLVGHNSMKFDIFFMRAALSRYPGLLQTFNQHRHLDTLAIAQLRHPNINSYSLATLCKYFSIKQEGAHRAMDDAIATMSLFNRLVSQASNLERYYQSIWLSGVP